MEANEMYDLRREVFDMKKEMKEVEREQQSFAMEFVQTLKTQNKRMFTCWLVTFIAFVILLAYTIWLYNDISVETSEYTQEINGIDTIENSNIINGD